MVHHGKKDKERKREGGGGGGEIGGRQERKTRSRRKGRSSEYYTTGHFGHFYERDAQERVFYQLRQKSGAQVGPLPLLVETGPETVRRRLFMRRTAEKDVSPWSATFLPSIQHASTGILSLSRIYNRRVLEVWARGERNRFARALLTSRSLIYHTGEKTCTRKRGTEHNRIALGQLIAINLLIMKYQSMKKKNGEQQ